MSLPTRNDADVDTWSGNCPDAKLRELVAENDRVLAEGTKHVRRRFAALEADIRRERELGIETRVMMGERELRMRDMLMQCAALARVFADGLDDLVAEW